MSIKNKINNMAISAYCKATSMKERAIRAFKKEDGDTNFLSIIIILAIVLIVAILFISLKDKIVDLVEGAWESFTGAFGGQDKSFGD